MTKQHKADDDRTLVITRVFDAPRALVYEAWTKPEHAKQWMAPRGMSVAEWENDARVGGTWRMVMGPAEGPEHRVTGKNLEVVPPDRLVFTHAWLDDDGKPGHETVCTVTFVESEGKTTMTFQQATFQSVEDRNGHREGWGQSFDNLAERVASLR